MAKVRNPAAGLRHRNSFEDAVEIYEKDFEVTMPKRIGSRALNSLLMSRIVSVDLDHQANNLLAERDRENRMQSLSVEAHVPIGELRAIFESTRPPPPPPPAGGSTIEREVHHHHDGPPGPPGPPGERIETVHHHHYPAPPPPPPPPSVANPVAGIAEHEAAAHRLQMQAQLEGLAHERKKLEELAAVRAEAQSAMSVDRDPVHQITQQIVQFHGVDARTQVAQVDARTANVQMNHYLAQLMQDNRQQTAQFQHQDNRSVHAAMNLLMRGQVPRRDREHTPQLSFAGGGRPPPPPPGGAAAVKRPLALPAPPPPLGAPPVPPPRGPPPDDPVMVPDPPYNPPPQKKPKVPAPIPAPAAVTTKPTKKKEGKGGVVKPKAAPKAAGKIQKMQTHRGLQNFYIGDPTPA